jgi:hypothetical protein
MSMEGNEVQSGRVCRNSILVCQNSVPEYRNAVSIVGEGKGSVPLHHPPFKVQRPGAWISSRYCGLLGWVVVGKGWTRKR